MDPAKDELILPAKEALFYICVKLYDDEASFAIIYVIWKQKVPGGEIMEESTLYLRKTEGRRIC